MRQNDAGVRDPPRLQVGNPPGIALDECFGAAPAEISELGIHLRNLFQQSHQLGVASIRLEIRPIAGL